MKQNRFLFFVILFAGTILIGCDKAATITDQTDNSILYEDATEAISASVGDESGGTTENFADVMLVAGGGSFGATLSKIGTDSGDVIHAGAATYDSLTGWWSVSVNRSSNRLFIQRSITREYQYQFLKNGIFQKRYLSGSDTAATMKFKIVSGTGYFYSTRISYTLTHLSGAWSANNINNDTITITLDSTYVRSGVDSIKTRAMLRTHTSTMTISSINIASPRYRSSQTDQWKANWRANFHHAISGTISGNYSATITFQKGDAYKEHSINRDFTITVNNGEGSLMLNGGGKFLIDLQAGNKK